jgi:hypothetical protein
MIHRSVRGVNDANVAKLMYAVKVLDDGERWYTAADLMAEAAAAGSPIKARLITDWVEKGLLDHPRRRGRGRGRGVVGMWPGIQRVLFRVLLHHRRRGVRRQADLCHWPVLLWLGSDGLDHDYVPIRQVRRCLTTWGTAYRTSPRRAARQAVEEAIEQREARRISRRVKHALIDALATATGGGPFDRNSLDAAVRQAFGSERFADLWVRSIEARLLAIERLDAFDDQTLETARSMVNQAPVIQARMAPIEDALCRKEVPRNACFSFITALGFLELARGQEPTNP